ncbi:MAG: hypothetical protein ABIK65_11605 [Candidatus Eisenbacteria bacterium]
MMKWMREPTLKTLGLGSVLEIFERGELPVDAAGMVDDIFGPAERRGAFVVSGANGIVGAGKMMQIGSRLEPFGVTMVGLDFPGAADGIGRQYPGLRRAFGDGGAARIMSRIVRLHYDGRKLPEELSAFCPAFLLEAIPEILEIKKAHYEVFRETFPGIEIRSVTSGFPSGALGVGIAHPAFPHEINKVWETVEPEPGRAGKLLWSLGLIPMPVSDDWSFVLDVLFCGLTLAALRYHRASNLPYWRIDKYVRRLVGPNPFRAHDAIGAKGANFLTWSCLHHLAERYGDVFTPAPELVYRKESGEDWYPQNHFRPVVNRRLDGGEHDTFETWILGPVIQMTSLMLQESRSHLTHINAIGEICAQFRPGVLALIRKLGPDEAIRRVEAYHALHPEAAGAAWYPGALGKMEGSDWRQLYVNAEHDGTVGAITIARESYNSDVDAELNRAIDWLRSEGIERVIVTGDFHLTTQLVGADTSEFYPALEDRAAGLAISTDWSRTARRLHDDFRVSVGFVRGKRCLGGMLELLMHCHYLVAEKGASLGMPEVTLPVVPGMEGCHWPLRKAREEDRPKIIALLLTGRFVNAGDALGWLVDYAGETGEALRAAWKIASGGKHGIAERPVEKGPFEAPPEGRIPAADGAAMAAARKAILACIRESCGAALPEALDVQARHSARFMGGDECRRGLIGSEAEKTMKL